MEAGLMTIMMDIGRLVTYQTLKLLTNLIYGITI